LGWEESLYDLYQEAYTRGLPPKFEEGRGDLGMHCFIFSAHADDTAVDFLRI